MPITSSPEVLPRNASAYINAAASYNVQTLSGSSAGTYTVNLETAPFVRVVNPAGNITLSLTGLSTSRGHVAFVEVVGRGTRTVTIQSASGTVYWDGGSAPTLASGTARSLLMFWSPNGTDFYGSMHFANLA